MKQLSHIDGEGRARMVDVSGKPVQVRTAEAMGNITLSDETRELITQSLIKKGDVLTIAEIAGVQAAKRTSELIPLCHVLVTDQVDVSVKLTTTGAVAIAKVRCHGRTGAEMEALTGVSVALLTVYDMCKAVDKNMVISDVKLMHKEKI